MPGGGLSIARRPAALISRWSTPANRRVGLRAALGHDRGVWNNSQMYESAPWRTELRKFAVSIDETPFWPGRDATVPFELERAVFFSAAVLRKLIEDRKVTDDFRARSITVETYRTKSPDKDHWFRDMPGAVELDWNTGEQKIISVYEVCNQLMHSLTREWIAEREEDPIHSVIVSSYRHQNIAAYKLGLLQWTDVLRSAADNNVTSIKLSSGLQKFD